MEDRPRIAQRSHEIRAGEPQLAYSGRASQGWLGKLLGRRGHPHVQLVHHSRTNSGGLRAKCHHHRIALKRSQKGLHSRTKFIKNSFCCVQWWFFSLQSGTKLGCANTRNFLNPAGSGIPGIFGSGNFGFRVRTNFQFTLQKMAILDFGSNFEAKRRISTYFGFLLHLR